MDGVDAILQYIAGDANSSDLYRIAHALKERGDRFDCLLHKLPEDVLLHICAFLQPSERLGFARAFDRCTRALDAVLLEETGIECVQAALQRLGDHDLYVLPNCLQMKTYFVCNWTAFSTSCPSYVGRTFWASKTPHARVECHRGPIKRAVRGVLRKGCAVLRVSSFLEAHHASLSSAKVRLKGRVCHIVREPIQTHEIVLLPPRLVLILQRAHPLLKHSW